jgi:hypothetical protein
MGFEAGMALELPWWAQWSSSFFAVLPVCVVGKNARSLLLLSRAVWWAAQSSSFSDALQCGKLDSIE